VYIGDLSEAKFAGKNSGISTTSWNEKLRMSNVEFRNSFNYKKAERSDTTIYHSSFDIRHS